MSVKVSPAELADKAAPYGPAAFVITTKSDGTSHVTHQLVTVADGVATCPAGKGTRAAVADRPSVVLLWPPVGAETYSLIADGQAQATEEGLEIQVTGAVLHRPAEAESC